MARLNHKAGRRLFATLICLVLLLGPGVNVSGEEMPQLDVTVGVSRILTTAGLERVAVTDPGIADVVVVSPTELILNGKKAGQTTLHVWDKSGRTSYMVQVTAQDDGTDVVNTINEAVADPAVKVRLLKGTVFLEGKVADRQAYDRAEKIAKVLADRLVNLLTYDAPPSAPTGPSPAEIEAKRQAEEAALKEAEQARAKAEEEALAKEEQARVKAEEEKQAKLRAEEIEASRQTLPGKVLAAIGLPDLRASILGESLVLDGTAPSQMAIDRALKIAGVLSTGLVKEVVSVAGIAPPEAAQVLLQVQIVEIYHDALNQLGITWGTMDTAGIVAGNFRVGQLTVGGPIQQQTQITGQIQAQLNAGTAKLLAAPSLLTVSGKAAEFLAGGEIPVPINTKDGVTIYWKEYGVKLSMQPEIRPDNSILVHLRPEASTLDWANAAKVNSSLMPAIKTRRAETDVRLFDGATLVIGGLLSSEESRNVQGLPVLAKLPIIGKLFGSEGFKKGQTELVIFVTPRLVKPGDQVRPEMVTQPKQLFGQETLVPTLPTASSSPASAPAEEPSGTKNAGAKN